MVGNRHVRGSAIGLYDVRVRKVVIGTPMGSLCCFKALTSPAADDPVFDCCQLNSELPLRP